MKKVYIYYPGPAIAILLLILNLTHIMTFSLWWLIFALWFGWIGIDENYKLDEPANVIWFPLIRKFLKKKNENI